MPFDKLGQKNRPRGSGEGRERRRQRITEKGSADIFLIDIAIVVYIS